MGRLQSMKTQFLMMMIGASLITMVCIGTLFLKTVLDATETKVEEFKAQLVADVERELKIQTETAISVIEQIYKKQQAGRKRRLILSAIFAMMTAMVIFGLILMTALMSRF